MWLEMWGLKEATLDIVPESQSQMSGTTTPGETRGRNRDRIRKMIHGTSACVFWLGFMDLEKSRAEERFI